jgi:phage terminase large subunit-like protein
MARKWSDDVRAAIRCGPVPVLRNWRLMRVENLTLGEKVCRFAEEFLHVPEGMHVGQPLRLDDWQVAFVLAIFDNPARTRLAICSLARRNGKSFIVAVILLAYILGPLAKRNITLASGALSRDQASLIYRLCEKMLHLSPKLQGHYRTIPSYKRINGLRLDTEYRALSADGASNLGNSFNLVLLDEAGQIRGPGNAFTDMLETSQGSFSDEQQPLMIILSTQAPSDADYLSVKIDDAIRSNNPRVVCHLYTASGPDAIENPAEWRRANPGLGKYRSQSDLAAQLQEAQRLPAKEASARNLLLNQRVALEQLWLAPGPWRTCDGEPDRDVFRTFPVAVGLDLSARTDLTAAVCAARDDDGVVHLLPFVFTPVAGLEDRARRDRAPYEQWVRDGLMIAVPGTSIDYEYVATFLRETLGDLGISPGRIEFDRWRIDIFKKAAVDAGFATVAEWNPVGQGYKDFSPRCEAFITLMLEGKLRHGGHPLLNMAAANAIAVHDAAGAVKLDKSKSTLRIDPLVAAVMAVFGVTDGSAPPVDISSWVA